MEAGEGRKGITPRRKVRKGRKERTGIHFALLCALARAASALFDHSGTHRAERQVDDQLAWPLINSRM
jgi:hypothetical protein